MFHRHFFGLVLASISACTTGNAQTLNQQISRGANFSFPAPDYQGWAAMQNAQTHANQAATQRRLIEEQTRAMQLENNQREAQAKKQQKPVDAQEMPPHMQQWLKSAQPRMHLFSNFEQVVFAQDVSISDDMIKLMASSPFAADIAYYLGSHKMEATAIKSMTMLEAARSISDIEKRMMVASKKAD